MRRNWPHRTTHTRSSLKRADCSVTGHFRQERYASIRLVRKTKTHLLAALLCLAACQSVSTPAPAQVSVRVIHDGQSSMVTSSGNVVRDVLSEQNIILEKLDRVSPSEFTALTDGMQITVRRVQEKLEREEAVIPFEKQVVRNEGLPVGETRLLQTGQSGLEEITYRIVLEDGVEVSKAILRRTIISDPLDEIVMVGAHSSFTVIPIEGTLAYLSTGNAWIMRNSSGSRKPLTVAGGLDGRVFQLSSNGEYLLYTRTLPKGEDANSSGAFNELWVVSTQVNQPVPFSLQYENVLWASWTPQEERTLALSTGEPRNTMPGWQANNDLRLVVFDEEGTVQNETILLEPSAGGSYGWYGMSFAWAPGGQQLAYSQADAVGIIDISNPAQTTLQRLTTFSHLQTWDDWVWLPSMSWSPDGRFLYTVTHAAPVGLEQPEHSPVFNLSAIALDGSFQVTLAERSGMWASPVIHASSMSNYRIAFLQALDPLHSLSSRYQLALMDQDGSNTTAIFPPEGEAGIKPQTVAWSPSGHQIALIHRGDLWIVEETSILAQQLTDDAQTSSPSWTN